jgi:hypothetical protein
LAGGNGKDGKEKSEKATRKRRKRDDDDEEAEPETSAKGNRSTSAEGEESGDGKGDDGGEDQDTPMLKKVQKNRTVAVYCVCCVSEATTILTVPAALSFSHPSCPIS